MTKAQLRQTSMDLKTSQMLHDEAAKLGYIEHYKSFLGTH